MTTKQMPRFKVLQCPHSNCGRLQISISEKFMACKFCGRRSPLRKNAAWNVKIYHMTDDAGLARKILLELTEKQAKSENSRVVPNLRSGGSTQLTLNFTI